MMKPKSVGQTYLAIFLLSMNMRLPIAALPPILPQIIRASGLPTSLAGIITTIPLLLFALGSPLIAKCAARFGRELTVVFFFALLSLGSLLRIKLAIPTLMLGTILIGLGIDGGNILLPSTIKDKLPHRELLGISLYTGGMNLISAIGIGSIIALTALWDLTQTMGALFAFSLLSLGGALLLHPPNGNSPVPSGPRGSSLLAQSPRLGDHRLLWFAGPALLFPDYLAAHDAGHRGLCGQAGQPAGNPRPVGVPAVYYHYPRPGQNGLVPPLVSLALPAGPAESWLLRWATGGPGGDGDFNRHGRRNEL